MSSSDQIGISHAQQLLLQLRETFLSELGERCDAMEGLMLTLRDERDLEAVYDELYRRVHSLKGSAGTHGIAIISTICHQLEDHLVYVDGHFERINGDFVDVCLAYLDLIRQAGQEEFRERPELAPIEAELSRLQQNSLAEKRPGLLVDSSPVMTMMYKQALDKLPVQLSTENDGLVALERLLRQKFDFLIMGKELKTLNGVALAAALRKSESNNRDIKIIVLTSKSGDDLGADIDFVIHRDVHLSSRLSDTVQQLIA
jgi:chemotaxis protein histidine kinase CheA